MLTTLRWLYLGMFGVSVCGVVFGVLNESYSSIIINSFSMWYMWRLFRVEDRKGRMISHMLGMMHTKDEIRSAKI